MNPLTQDLLTRIGHLPRSHAFFKRSGISWQTVYNWRKGRQSPSLALYVAAIETLGGKVTVQWTPPKS